MEDWLSETGLYENPLVPNAKLRQMYGAMAEARVLDEHIARLQGRAKKPKGRGADSTRGQEACRVSTAIDLGPGDLVSDSHAGFVMELLAGAKVGSLLKHVADLYSPKKAKGKAKGAKPVHLSGRLLPWIDDAGERLRMAMGAALSFKTLGRPNVVLAYVRHGEMTKGGWRQVLELAGKLELPVIFVVLPVVKGKQRNGATNLSGKTARWGVPGIPVDAADAVALYRVAQESMGRTRAGDGPVLIECIEYRAKGKSGSLPVDPLAQMKANLLNRKLGTEAWLNGAGDRLTRRIAVDK
jgi:TPP-dependent pyruvate/acetoin dehydrogenase alpha subunit